MQGHVQHADYGQPDGQDQGGAMGGEQHVSVFQMINQKLLALGIPRFTFGRFILEPVVTIGFLLAGIFFGIPGLIFAGVLFLVSVISQPGGNPFTRGRQAHQGAQRPGGDGGGGGGGGFGGTGGHRLGRL